MDYKEFKTGVIALFYENKILILKIGSTAPWMPNKWSIVGGVIEDNETPKNAILREGFEEIGLIPKNVSFKYKKETDDCGTIFYYSGILENNDVKLDYENSEFKFITKDEVDNYDFVPHVKEFIIQLFSNKKYDIKFKKIK